MIFAVVALALTACDPKPKPTKDVTFQITVSNVTASEATVAVAPSVDTVAYYFSVIQSSLAAEYASPEAMADSVLAYLVDMCEYFTSYGYDMTLDSVCSLGADSYDFEELDPATAYTAFAFAVDTKNEAVLGKMATATFTTGEIQNVSLSFQIVPNDTSVWFMPSNKNIEYVAFFVDQDSLASYGYNNPQNFFNDYCAYMVSEYQAYYDYYGIDYKVTLSDLATSGDVYVPYVETEDGETITYIEQGHTYLWLAQACDHGVFNSDFISMPFSRLNAASAPEKLQKGQFNKQMKLKKAKKIQKVNANFNRARIAK